jgi:tripartite-type tricarboxylate transporter receptor subunit TctC
MQRRDVLKAVLAFGVGLELVSLTHAQSYPTRPITMVIPYAAGGHLDTVGRILAEGMRTSLGQPVIVENVPGASGTIGVGRVARAVPDGNMFVLGNLATHVLNGPMFTLPYDLQKDFQPVALIANEPFVIVARKTISANDLAEFVIWLRSNPGATQGTSGAGGFMTVAGLLFQRETGTRFRSVPYRGGQGPAIQDLLAGQIDFMIAAPSICLPFIRTGMIKAYAVTSKIRLAAASDIPTVGEAGLTGLHALNWQATFLPKATPKDIVTRLNAAVVIALADPSVRQRLAAIGQEIFPREQQTPEALSAFQSAEVEKWWPIVKAANVKGK